MLHTDSNGKVDRVIRRIVKIDKSPMNQRVNVLQFDCGHDGYQPVDRRLRPRVGGLVDCGECLRLERGR